jgi:hypothetical protein
MKNSIVYCALGFVTGLVVGYIVGSNNGNKVVVNSTQATTQDPEPKSFENDNEYKESMPVVITSSKPAKIATEDEPGINYTDYVKKVNALKYEEQTAAPTDGDETELTEEQEDKKVEPMEETYAERVAREKNEIMQAYLEKKKNSIDILGEEGIDHDYPDINYGDPEELYYFMPDDLLTTLDGMIVPKENLGKKLVQFNWYQNPNQLTIYVRNNILQKDYHVTKVDETMKDHFNVDMLNDL